MTNIRPPSSPASSSQLPRGQKSAVPAAFVEVKSELLAATAKGRGNSEWLSYGDARRILIQAEDAGPQVAALMRDVFRDALHAGKVDDNNLILGGRALKLLSEFTGVDPQVYLDVAGDKAAKAQTASMKARGLLDHQDPASTFVAANRATHAPRSTSKTGGWDQVMTQLGTGLRDLAAVAKDAPDVQRKDDVQPKD